MTEKDMQLMLENIGKKYPPCCRGIGSFAAGSKATLSGKNGGCVDFG